MKTFKLVINNDDDTGVSFVALVDRPAIEKNFEAFKVKQRFTTTNESKRIVTGALMLADHPIYRYSESMGEYYVIADKEVIEQIILKFSKQGNQSNVNMMHDANKEVSDVFMFESYIINRARGINPPKGHEDAKDGSWFGSYKVDNFEVWEKFISSGELKGFSIEGLFDYEEVKDNKVSELISALSDVLSNI